jgi:hypothetical protein
MRLLEQEPVVALTVLRLFNIGRHRNCSIRRVSEQRVCLQKATKDATELLLNNQIL